MNWSLLFCLVFVAFASAQTQCPIFKCGENCTTSGLVAFSCSDCWTEYSDCLALEAFQTSTTPGAPVSCRCISDVSVCLNRLNCQTHMNILTDRCSSDFPTCDCGTIGLNPPTTLEVLSVCPQGSFCVDNQTCSSLVPLGGFCTQNSECEDFPFANTFCANGVCLLSNLPTGESCFFNEECASGVCNLGVCQAGLENTLCTKGTCPFGSFCFETAGRCLPQLREGEACFPASDTQESGCPLGTVCGASGVCSAAFIAPQGFPCVQDWECEIGLYCSKNITFSSTSLSINTTALVSSVGICQQVPLSPIPCISDFDCTSLGNAFCTCSPFTGQSRCEILYTSSLLVPPVPIVNPPLTIDSFQNLVSCLNRNNCTSFSAAPTSCASVSCNDEMQCFLFSLEQGGLGNFEAFEFGCSALVPPVDLNSTCPEFGGRVPGEPQCLSQSCCQNLANPNPVTGAGYLQFNLDCLNGGLHCVEDTGCQLCFLRNGTGPNEGNRPFCTFAVPLPCVNETCCEQVQIPNPQTGAGYLQFDARCLNGGLHCVENSGCELCFNPSGSGPNEGFRPVCDRFQSLQESANTNAAISISFNALFFLFSIILALF